MSYDFTSLFPPDRKKQELAPIVAMHRMVWRNWLWDGWTWVGEHPEPGGVLALDTGSADMLSPEGYALAARIAGAWPQVLIIGTGGAVDSLRRCLEQYRANLKEAA